MTQVLIIRDKLIDFYARYDYWFTPAVKALAAAGVFLVINANIGYLAAARNPAVILVAALLCSFLPWCALSLFSAGFVLANLSQVSFEMTVIAGAALLLFALLMAAFKPGHSELIAILAALCFLRVPYALPVIAGLSVGAAAVLPTALGTLSYFMVVYFRDNVSAFTVSGAEDSITEMAGRYAELVNGFLSDRYALAMLLALCAAVLVVWMIRRTAVDYAWNIAIVAGLAVSLLVILGAGFFMSINVPVMQVVLGTLASAVICFAYELFFYSVDYARTELLQFEDDEYYYYVKAVPKMKVSRTDVKVKSIT